MVQYGADEHVGCCHRAAQLSHVDILLTARLPSLRHDDLET